MPIVLRKKPSYLPLINGVKFTQIEPGVSESEEVAESVAELFLAVPGYSIKESAEPDGEPDDPAKEPDSVEPSSTADADDQADDDARAAAAAATDTKAKEAKKAAQTAKKAAAEAKKAAQAQEPSGPEAGTENSEGEGELF